MQVPALPASKKKAESDGDSEVLWASPAPKKLAVRTYNLHDTYGCTPISVESIRC